MRVAILGAGLSGLACAHQLERWGISYDIFERSHRIGERFPHMEAVLFAMHRPFGDPVPLLREHYGLQVQPEYPIRRLVLHGPSTNRVLTGHLGWTHFRGHVAHSVEQRIVKQITTPVHLEQAPRVQDLIRSYEWVVVATGDPGITAELTEWENDAYVTLVGGPVPGTFDPEEAQVWFGTELADRGYTFLLPYGPDKAALVAAVTTRDHGFAHECFARSQQAAGVSSPQDQIFTYDLSIGQAPRRQVGNVLLVGHAGGFIDPFAGFGQVPSLLSGILAARAIATGEDFDKLTAWQRSHYKRCLHLRHRFGRWDNRHFDRMVRLLGTPVGNFAAHTRLNGLAFMAGAARLAEAADQLRGH